MAGYTHRDCELKRSLGETDAVEFHIGHVLGARAL